MTNMAFGKGSLLMVVVLLTSIIGSLGCDGEDEPEFGIYLVDSGEMVLSEDHIKAYYQDTHTVELNEEGIEKWNSYMTYTTIPKLDACLFSKDFVLKIEGDEIYRGQFYSMASSLIYPGIVIMDALFKLDSTHNTITISFGYFYPILEDPRNNPRVIGFLEKKGLLKHGEPQDQPTTTEPASNPESSESAIAGESQWEDFWGFSTGSNYEGYHLETGSMIYHLQGGITKVYGPDNELIMCVNDAEVNEVYAPGGGGPQPATHFLNLPNGSFITGDGFITRAAGLTVVNLSSSSYDDKFVDREAFSGFWRATGGDTVIPESEREHGKIYNYDWYDIMITDNDRATVTWDNGLNRTTSEGTINEDEIKLSFGSSEAVFRIHDQSTAFVAFYDDDKVYVKQLTKEELSPIETIVGIQVKPQPGGYLSCSDRGSSGILLQSVSVETAVSNTKFFNPDAGPLQEQVDPGDLIVVITGEVENRSGNGPYVAIWAKGYDVEGNIVSWTLDIAHITGQSQVHVQCGDSNSFTLHLSFSEMLRVVEVYSCAYSEPPP